LHYNTDATPGLQGLLCGGANQADRYRNSVPVQKLVLVLDTWWDWRIHRFWGKLWHSSIYKELSNVQ
jgi:hypothetical protein